MASNSQLTTLIELAERDADKASKRLGAATQAVQDAQQKLTMLFGYRDDYAQKLINRGGTGMSPGEYQNFLAFMQKLDNAISGQQGVLEMAEQRVEQEKLRWQECEKKRLSYSTLQKRALEKQLQKENKRDQKAMDEYAARKAYYKR